MGRSRHGRWVTVAMGALVVLVGCSVAADPHPTGDGSTTSVASASPTQTAMVIAGGERPPAIAEECNELISVEDLSAAVGTQVQTFEKLDAGDTSANLGAVLCGWSTSDDADSSDGGAVWVMPRAGMDVQEFTALGETSGYRCLYRECTALTAGVNLLVGATVPTTSDDEAANDVALATAARVGTAILEASGDNPGSWVRDRESWVDGVDCNGVGSALSDAIGRDVQAWSGLEFDPPRLWGTAADQASRLTSCEFEAMDDPGVTVIVETDAGMAWTVPRWVQSLGFSETEDDGMSDVASYTNGDHYYLLSDGTNRVRVYCFDRSGFDSEGQARARDTFPPVLMQETASRILAGEFSD